MKRSKYTNDKKSFQNNFIEKSLWNILQGLLFLCEVNMLDKLIVHELSSEFEELEIFPLVDVHVGDDKTDIRLFRQFVQFILEKPNRFVTLQGDLMNNALKTSVSNVYNETMNPHEQKKWLIVELRPIAHRILCIVPGNHEERSTKDVDDHPMEDLAIALNIEKNYRGNGAFIKVCFGKNITNGKRLAYVICCIHGFGGGAKPGAAANRIEDFLYTMEGVDIIVMGHVHKKLAGRPSKIVIDTRNNTITQRDTVWAIAAPWQDYGGYGFRMMLRPGTKGKTPIKLYGTYKDFNVTI